jgi:chromosome segregation ATPase
VDTAKPIETTPQHYRFEVKLPARSYGEGPAREVKDGKAEFKVTEESLGQSTVEITNINSDRILYYVQQKYIDQKTRNFLEKVVAAKAEIADLKTQLAEVERKRTTVLTDQEHMRLNLQTLKDSELERDLRNTYVKQFAEEEKQLSDLGARMDQLRETIEKKQKGLDDLISGFTFETEL